MPKRAAAIPFPPIVLDRPSNIPLYRQIYNTLQKAVLSGQLIPGTRLPATRALADQLGVSRNCIISAFEQLFAEGYIEKRVGAGTYVSSQLPDGLIRHQPHAALTAQPDTRPRIAGRQELLTIAEPLRTVDQSRYESRMFQPGLPAIDAFPTKLWQRLLARRWRDTPSTLLMYGEPAGYQPLREAIAAYLGAARGVRCHVEQILIVDGSQQALDLAARVLLNPGDSVWIEDPGYIGAKSALLGSRAQLVYVPVDDQGLDVVAGIAQCADARLVYASPSHQYPLGVVMSLKRRLALLEWANRHNAWVLEDDYDSEYRYRGAPLASLQGLDTENRVIYLGTFSKVLFPSLRLGYMVVPPDLIEEFRAMRAIASRHSPLIEQAVLADFISQGHFAHHVRRMRALYAERQRLLIAAITSELDGLLEVQPTEAGMHLVGWLPEGVDDRSIVRQAALQGMKMMPLSLYSHTPLKRGGLLLGYACVNEHAIRTGVQKLKVILEKYSANV
jgi:GntR family transcriptional regulator/MocR family aminotransferase